MNGNRLYRSTADAKVGGVAAGLGTYFKVDPTIFRIIFVVATVFSGGTFALAYLALWLFLPTAASTSSDLGGIVKENMDELGSKVRGFTGNPGFGPKAEVPRAQPGSNPGGANTMPVGEYPSSQPSQQTQAPQQGSTQHRHMGLLPILLIAFGIMFLMGGFHPMHWDGGARGFFPWPLLLIGLCFLVFRGRRYR